MVDFTQGEFRRLDDDATLECHGVLKEGVVRRSMGLVAGALSLFGVVASDAAMAQTPGTASSFPAWAYPWAPDYKLHQMMAFQDTFPIVRPHSPSRRNGTFSLRRTGTLMIILPCRTLSPTGDNPMYGPAVHVTAPRERADRRTQVWPVFPPPISFSRWPTTKAAPESFQARTEALSC